MSLKPSLDLTSSPTTENLPPQNTHQGPSKNTFRKQTLLKLVPFQQPPCVSFGNCRIGTKASRTLIIQNPNSQPENVKLFNWDQICDKGISFSPESKFILPSTTESSHEECEENVEIVQPHSSLSLEINWKPIASGNFRICLNFLANSKKFQVYLLGFAVADRQPVAKKASNASLGATTKSLGVSKRKAGANEQGQKPGKKSALTETSKVKSSAVTTKPKPKTASMGLSKHITRSELYDDHWASKQQRAFTKWINFEFTNLNCSSSTICGSLSQFTKNLEHEKIRRAAGLMYQAEPQLIVWNNLSEEIDAEKIRITADLNIVADIGLREKIISKILQSYNPFWLTTGLEVILGRNIDTPEICKLTHAISIHLLGEDGSPKGKRKFLKKLLMLIYFLDKAKITRLLPGDPCLFNKVLLFQRSCFNVCRILPLKHRVTCYLNFHTCCCVEKEIFTDIYYFLVIHCLISNCQLMNWISQFRIWPLNCEMEFALPNWLKFTCPITT